MASGKKRKKEKDDRQNSRGKKADIQKTKKNIQYREFPGPDNVEAPLRVAFDKEAYADFIIHARSNLDSEICGVLAGTVCEDDKGLYIHIHTTIQGNAVKQGATHVTFTQETWNNIHERLDNDYPEYHILGWYHSHPGFGVEFSDMDNFIQENFFPLPTQIGLLTDPLKGDVSVCINTGNNVATGTGEAEIKQKKTAYLDKFWVNGRPVLCYTPIMSGEKTGTAIHSPVLKRFENFETRFNQFLEKEDSQKRGFYSIIMFIGLTILIAVLGFIGFNLYKSFTFDNKEIYSMDNYETGPLVIEIGDEMKIIGDKPVSIPITTQVGNKKIFLEIIFRGFVFSSSPDNEEESR